ncbi:nicotinic acid mononucleotide adenyltransferase [Mangrovimonas sp. AS39]|uniref:toxin-antitoxin system YwqK family antitoxin n=1 Tax=Mangrovimonas TaxID=1211036 RepID=UPI001423EBA0|nr:MULTISPECIES: nicotinic acid mononucleotide adenyltransferase [Mangrovimonas]MCF1190067.1 nicotinic acid mononucleotide adenyltransferase [Mangrovimonas futianensis]MCF1194182.1 nicotinic acid mononucleotide adenyltransferase [Mangrovimonas futianensis]MCF1421736.1 nicotinic acid mononucleotide adenyltransferase [Mangrovimonas futianensis]NIK90635.1 nicotinic acid mononucleotide adenyltransferase [Mangrovimonas sp. CR14]
MKKLVILVMMLAGVTSFAQSKLGSKIEKSNKLYEATYYHDNGVVSQTGYFNQAGKLQGTWTSFDLQGNKLAQGKYDNGQKVGKWFFWTETSLKEVDYSNNTIASVSEWTNKAHIASRD